MASRSPLLCAHCRHTLPYMLVSKAPTYDVLARAYQRISPTGSALILGCAAVSTTPM